MHDLVIRHGTVVDGTRSVPRIANIAIDNGIITAVGKELARGKREIEAEGYLVTPGFVDIHTHYDGQVSWDSLLAPSSINGVTSIAMGNCGVGFAPARPDKHAWLIALLEGIEDIPGTALAEGLRWDWQSFPEYLDAIERQGYTVDVGAHMPHAALRSFVMGERGADHTIHPSDDEIKKMEQLTYEALQAGAVGFSTSRTFVHRSRDGNFVGTLSAKESELVGIVRAIRRKGAGVIQVISDAYMTEDDDFAESELALMRRLIQVSGARLSTTVLQTDQTPERWRYMLRRISDMAAEGLPIKAQVAPRPVGLMLSFAGSVHPFLMTPTFRTLSNLSLEERSRALAQPDMKVKILNEHSHLSGDHMFGLVITGFSRMFRVTDPVDYEPEGNTSLQAEADARGLDAASYVYDVLLEEHGKRLLYMPIVNYAGGDLKAVYEMMVADNTLYGLSDGGAHCGTICDASFPTTTLSLWSHGDKKGRHIPIEKLVHGYTQRNAAHVGWLDRGVIAPGYLADLNVIDLDDLNLSPPAIVQDLPAGGTRLMQTAKGYRWTIKSGIATFENGKWTGELPGHLLRGVQLAPA